MTSLIDVIFLLLLFFMLSSTFSRFAEVELTTGGTRGGVTTAAEDTRLMFLRLTKDAMTLNGQTVDRDSLRDALTGEDGPGTLLISVTLLATAQQLTDVLADLRDVPELTLSVLDAS